MAITDKQKQYILGNKRQPPFWFYILLVSIPIIFFILLEAGLRIFNYGRDVKVWVDVSEDVQILNPAVSYRYFFNTKNIPFSIESFIEKDKKANSFRVFVLGASSGAGYPYHTSASMSKFIRKKLEILYPEITIEVPNLSMAAINSYAVLDLVPEIIKKDPDLILIYIGHNEYYGALGIGSFESLGSSRFIVKMALWLNKFKTIELLRSIINIVSGLFSSDETVSKGTLMAQMAQEKVIEFNSEIYRTGISQFEGNLRDIISSCKDEGIPVITGTLVSNLKDQKPFASIYDGKYPPADEVYLNAKQELINGNKNTAESLFVYAKELDALRFRAPKEFNKSIVSLSNEFGYPVINVDSLFNSISPDNIVGNNLLTDHLHPNVNGYQLMGNLYFSAMKRYNFLPKGINPAMDENVADSLVKAHYNFTALDSTIADFRTKILKNNWPFISPEKKKLLRQILHINNFIDSIALSVIDAQISRERARTNVANIYWNRGEFDNFANAMHALIEEFPYEYKYYSIAAKELIEAKKYSLAYSFLQRGFNKHPDAFTSKWLGIINLSQKNVDEAIFYLQKSLSYNSNDPQTLYNITGAYAEQKNFNKALDAINKCLQLYPKYPRAAGFRDRLLTIVGKNN